MNRFLGDYVVNLDESQLSLGIWKGNGVAAPGSRETAARFLVASSVLDQSGAATCSCPPRPSSYVKRGGGSRAGGARAVRLGEARAEASRPGGALDLGAGDPWPPLGKGVVSGSFALGCQEGSDEPMASRARRLAMHVKARRGQRRHPSSLPCPTSLCFLDEFRPRTWTWVLLSWDRGNKRKGKPLSEDLRVT